MSSKKLNPLSQNNGFLSDKSETPKGYKRCPQCQETHKATLIKVNEKNFVFIVCDELEHSNYYGRHSNTIVEAHFKKIDLVTNPQYTKTIDDKIRNK